MGSIEAIVDHRLLIDTDAGIDDAVAILLALRTPGVRVEALTAVAGNVDVDQCVRNVRYVLELCGCKAPVYRGADGPASGRGHSRAPVHGTDGLGDLGLRPTNARPAPGPAAERIVALARASPGQITLLALAPLTNIAAALRLEPRLPSLLRAAIVLGGAVHGPGGVTPRAEFNIWFDPESAREVFRAGLPLTLAPIELSRGEAAWTAADIARIGQRRTPQADFVAALWRVVAAQPRPGLPATGAGFPDAIAAAVAINSALIRRAGSYFVDVETSGELTAGEAVVDLLGVFGRPANVTVVEAIDVPSYKQMLVDACR